MNRYAIYDTTTGEILRIVRCTEALAPIQCREGQAFIVAADEAVTDATHSVVDGQFVPLPLPPEPPAP